MLTVGSLFSGIGGLDLGLERAGMSVRWHSEIDPYACRVLKKHWPDVPNLGNIKEINWKEVEKVDVICGGYPCQPFSTAGKRQGENDPRHLWPYFRNAISAIRPRYALLENVRGHLSMGATTVIGDLAQIGYDCQWQLISARSIGAPHKRERLFIVAHANSQRWERCFRTQEGKQATSGLDLQGENRRWGDHWIVEPDVGRVAHGIPSRVDRLRGLGNAVVPQIAEYVGRLIMEEHNEHL